MSFIHEDKSSWYYFKECTIGEKIVCILLYMFLFVFLYPLFFESVLREKKEVEKLKRQGVIRP